jgi:hypothetical protein
MIIYAYIPKDKNLIFEKLGIPSTLRSVDTAIRRIHNVFAIRYILVRFLYDNFILLVGLLVCYTDARDVFFFVNL